MIYINKSESLNQLKTLVKENIGKNLSYMPDDFNEQQQYALTLFQNRIFLEEVIEETIKFNRNINWENRNENIKLATNAEVLVDIFQLRSEVFHNINYQNAFPDTIEGLNFDKYDKNSAIIYYKNSNHITGTVRIIFDSINNLPSESIMPFNKLRDSHGKICELSRNTIKHKTDGLSLEFKNLMNGVHNVVTNNDIDITVSGIKKEHHKLCSKFGGLEILKELPSYGEIDVPCLLITWDLNNVSNFFQKAILK